MQRPVSSVLLGAFVIGALGACEKVLNLSDFQKAAPGVVVCKSVDDCESKECFKESCSNTFCAYEPLAAGDFCGANQTHICDGMGSCGGCANDGIRDGSETDVDCGDGCSQKCDELKACKTGADCISGNCPNLTCVNVSCVSGFLDGEETDVDCGGKCDACPLGKKCRVAQDCETGSCASGICCSEACSGVCEQCSTSGTCLFVPKNDDPLDQCPNDSCDGAGQCKLCHSGLIDSNETDLDCGGGVCRPCPIGKACSQGPRDCESCICEGNICAAAKCDNQILDGCESDTDCGGPCGATCLGGQHCLDKSDCLSGSCQKGLCG